MSDFTVNIPEPSQQALYIALGDAIEQLDPARKSSENPYFNSKYADLNQLLSMVKPVLSANGLTMTQQPITEVIPGTGNVPPVFMVGCKTVLVHCASGGRLENDLLLPCTKLDPQAGGSAISYSKRYAIKALFLMQDVDDDGNSASHQPQQQPAIEFRNDIPRVSQVSRTGQRLPSKQVALPKDPPPPPDVSEAEKWATIDVLTQSIQSATTEGQLNAVYNHGINGNPNLSNEQIQTLVEDCRKRKESISSKQQ